MSSPILNIICFHGFTQNASTFEKKLSKLLKAVKNDIKQHYLEGIVNLPTTEQTASKAYWVYSIEDPLNVSWLDHYKENTNIYFLKESLDAFLELVNKIGRVDGIIGFSQGGCFADYICKLQELKQISCDIKFVIFISAKYFDRSGYLEDKIINPTIKSLHIYGKSDQIIPPKLSQKLSEYYPNKTVFVHDGAHIIPSNSAAKTTLKEFIKNQ